MRFSRIFSFMVFDEVEWGRWVVILIFLFFFDVFRFEKERIEFIEIEVYFGGENRNREKCNRK